MRRATFEKEEELAAVVVGYLEHLGWDVYQEVEQGGICDIVGVRGPLVWAIETKLAFGTAVLEQARELLVKAHLVSVATPVVRGPRVLQEYCDWKGIGWLRVSNPKLNYNAHPALCVREEIGPVLHRRLIGRGLRAALRPEHKTMSKAGAAGGGYFTPFKDTCEKVRRYLREHPEGASLKDLVDGVSGGHYRTRASARSSIAHWARRGQIEGVKVVDGPGRAVRLYLG